MLFILLIIYIYLENNYINNIKLRSIKNKNMNIYKNKAQ
jgi:hypothetical protein